MSRNTAPAIDHRIAPRSAIARDGQPLSNSRAPSPDLAPWVGRLYVTSVSAPDTHVLSCGLFCEGSVLRIQLDGDWQAQSADGPVTRGRDVILFGPQTKRMPVQVRGGFTSVGISFRPGAMRVLGGRPEPDNADRLNDPAQIGVDRGMWLDMLRPDAEPDVWCKRMENALRLLIAHRDAATPDAVTARFERISYANPSASVGQCAEEIGIDIKRLERIVRRDFGMTPKQVLRRARALDMASHLRGVADRNEAEALMLRYYDQSHLNRDFTALIGLSPRQFAKQPQPLMTLCLETRQSRRLEILERIAPGESPPWHAPVPGD